MTLLNSKNPDVLAIKGKFPQNISQAEKDNWFAKLDDLRVILEDDLSPYAYPKGPVIEHGWNINSYFEVTLYKGMNVTDSQINEIYDAISKAANKESIQEVPVVFLKGDFVQDAVLELDVKTSNLSISGEKTAVELNNSSNNNSEPDSGSSSNINNSNGNKSSKINSTPDFELLGGLACLYGIWRLRKK